MIHARIASLRRNLILVAWNANGILSRIEELREFLVRHKPDVLLINETHLSPHDRVRLPNYVLHKDKRPVQQRRSGGTAFAVNTFVGRHHVILPPRRHIKATAVELPGVLDGVLVVLAYKPPQRVVLDTDLEALLGAHGKVILAGDLNCKHPDWGSRLATRTGCLLQGYAISHHLWSDIYGRIIGESMV